ncbi:MAG: type II secretion system F family protein [Corynebacterium sp.]|uniref:type II secretion system F family protein n=1 Tax=Corynebacterium sp. TaxID=1720 RepID=UPI0026DF5508|nr:type II secretion system F family protein [Corynebacterium sp.]MDO5668499.1 type II secretion system F family protein [Corynebacterium sp.]
MTALLLIATHLVLPTPAPATRIQPGSRPRLTALPLLGIGLLLLVLGNLTATVAGLLAAAAATWVIRDARSRALTRRREKCTAAFLGHLVGELRTGHSMTVAVDHAAEHLPAETPRDLADTLLVVRSHVHRGISGAAALDDAPPELAPLAALWRLADRHGLPLTALVAQAQTRLDARLRHRDTTTATLQGPQATAVILTLLPLAGIAMGTAMGADPVGFLTGGGLGGVLLVLGTALAAGGFVWARHIIGKAAA